MYEDWNDIPGYEGYYQVSTKGRVKSLVRKGNKNEKILNPRYTNSNIKYISYALRKDKSVKYLLGHRLVMLAFVENTNGYEFVNHIDNNGTNNNIENLEWCTRKQNQQHSAKQGRCMGKLNQMYGTKKMSENALKNASESIGLEYGYRTVLSVFSNGKTIRASVKCRCGHIGEISIGRLKKGHGNYCRSCTQKKNNELGMK